MLKRALIILMVLFLVSCVSATDYYVDATNGNDANNGLSDATAWQTIAKVNSFSFSPGDNIKFKRGEVFSDATLGCGPTYDCTTNFNVDGLTIEDYGIGEKPWIGGSQRRSINFNEDTLSNLIIRNVKIDGQNWGTDYKLSKLSIRGINNLVLDGVEGDGSVDYQGPYEYYKYPISISSCTGIIEVKNCVIQWWGPIDTIPDGTGGDYVNHIQCPDASQILIHDNLIHHMESDGFHLRHNGYPNGIVKIYNNEIYNCGENAIDLKASSNVEIYNNHFYRTPDFTGVGGAGGTDFPLITAHTDIANFEGYFNENNVVRDNILGPSDGPAIRLSGGSNYSVNNFTVMNNKILNCKRLVTIGTYVEDSKFYNNIIFNVRSNFVFDWAGSTANVKFHHNTFYSNNDIDQGLYLGYSYSEFKNNIFYIDDIDSYTIYMNNGNPSFSHNLWYNPSNTNYFNWSGTIYTSSQQTDWQNAGHPGDIFTDPLFIDAVNGNFHLLENSPACTASETGSYIGAYSCLSTSTCQSLNYNCCDSCESGPQSLYDGDCPGVCCGVCVTPSACGDADSDFSGVVSITELINYITGWKAGNVNIADLINGITEWKNGC